MTRIPPPGRISRDPAVIRSLAQWYGRLAAVNDWTLKELHDALTPLYLAQVLHREDITGPAELSWEAKMEALGKPAVWPPEDPDETEES